MNDKEWVNQVKKVMTRANRYSSSKTDVAVLRFNDTGQEFYVLTKEQLTLLGAI